MVPWVPMGLLTSPRSGICLVPLVHPPWYFGIPWDIPAVPGLGYAWSLLSIPSYGPMALWDPMEYPSSPRSGICLVPLVHPVLWSHGTLGSHGISQLSQVWNMLSPSCPSCPMVTWYLGIPWDILAVPGLEYAWSLLSIPSHCLMVPWISWDVPPVPALA